MVKLSGKSIIGSREGTEASTKFRAHNPKTGSQLDPEFSSATAEDVNRAAELAHAAFQNYSRSSGREKGKFLRQIASNIETVTSELVERAELETALPKPRLQSETARTCNQLRLFAQLVEEGSWLMARIDRPDPDRKPLPKPDIRSLLRPLGPVVVFGASNFPLAFSVAGGDTASALAGGNPVIVKGHSAHPGTSEIVGRAVREAVRQCNLPEGVFSLLFGGGNEVGAALMKHPLVKAGGFTGSRTAGKILMNVAASRPEPIPFYAEMSSTNPVFILPGALREDGQKIAAGLHASFTLGAGQFCTKPGMVFVSEGPDASRFSDSLRQAVIGSAPFHLLTDVIRASYGNGIGNRRTKSNLRLIAEATSAKASDLAVDAVLFETDAQSFLKDPELAGEIFGPSTLLVRHSRREEVLQIARELEGHLTATIHGTESDLRDFSDLVAILEQKVGRLVFNGFPTGVEVSHAMVHGGPFPATSDGRSTSVGTQAIYRFCRPVCFQGFPDSALPDELKDENPLGIWRMIDGEMTREAVLKPHQLEVAG
ncbi:MAG TPA: aldehyde dehydrogenase (NADP(+)) [Terriglobales bacterium]|nr:aldehyde dehydrogenase (NADP(+)) [Terriglobales bacterium]